jgi:adenosylhomocysteine nucleosidase
MVRGKRMKERNRLAFLCATGSELECLSACLDHCVEEPSPEGMRVVSGSRGPAKIIAAAGGMGKVAAAMAASRLIFNYDPRLLVSFGIAGALDCGLGAGDIVVASELVQGDVGVIHSRGFKMTGPGLHLEEGFRFCKALPVSPQLLDCCLKAGCASGISVKRGRIVTCDQVVLDPAARAELGSLLQAIAVDMEGAAAGQVASSFGVDFIDVRAISDEADFDLAGLEKALPERGLSRTGLIMKYFFLRLLHPSILEGLRELERGKEAGLTSLGDFLRELIPALDQSYSP